MQRCESVCENLFTEVNDFELEAYTIREMF